ncbi:MAG: SURF1 family protein [Gammaproteobacteria bacterium]|nr:SURF1 family protein [Gammaproteobacteria bacterium]
MSDTPAKQRRPSWLPLVAMLLILPVLLYLGMWQLNRAEQKQEMFDRFGTTAVAVDLVDLLDQTPEALRYRQVSLNGRFVSHRQFLLEGMANEGRPGLQVLTPFRLPDTGIVIVNRGWIPETRTRDTQPDLAVDESPRQITGRVVPFPEPGMRLASEPGSGWPRRFVYPTAVDIATALETEVYPHMIWLDTDAADGYLRQWKPFEFGPARHMGYAVQWFALAVTLVLIYIILRFRRRQQ